MPDFRKNEPNLPFLNIAEQTVEASEEDLKRWESLTQTERTIAIKWAEVIPGLNPKTVTRELKFFDLEARVHNLTAQQMLLNTHKETGAKISISELYKHPSLAGFSAQVDKLLVLTNQANGDAENEVTYTQSYYRPNFRRNYRTNFERQKEKLEV